MRAIKIDATEQTITEVDIPKKDNLKALQEAVGGYIEIAYRFPQDTLFVNEEGLLSNEPVLPGFQVWGAHQPFAGNGIITGGKGGSTVDAKISLEEVRNQVRFVELTKRQ